MAGYIIVGTLAAFGVVSLVWALLGWLLPSGAGCALVCWGTPDEGILSRYRWLRGTGLLRCPLIAVEADCPQFRDDVEICAGKDLPARLEWERNRENGTGTGDIAGCHQRRGISEL